jgi:hypothetical protein
MDHSDNHSKLTWASPAYIALFGFVLVISYILFTEHMAHVVWYLPWLLLIACPLMHIFHHHGHQHGGDGAEKNQKDQKDKETHNHHHH